MAASGDSMMRRLRMVGLSPTVPRICVLQVLEAASGGLAVEEVCAQLRLRGTGAGMGTVYRVLNELASHGLLLKDTLQARKLVYRLAHISVDEPILRLSCPGTGQCVLLTDEALQARVMQLALSQGIDDGQGNLLLELLPVLPAPAITRAREDETVVSGGGRLREGACW